MEAIRLTTVGGETRHYGFTATQLEKMIPFLKTIYGESIEVRSVRKQSEIMNANFGRMLMDSYFFLHN